MLKVWFDVVLWGRRTTTRAHQWTTKHLEPRKKIPKSVNENEINKKFFSFFFLDCQKLPSDEATVADSTQLCYRFRCLRFSRIPIPILDTSFLRRVLLWFNVLRWFSFFFPFSLLLLLESSGNSSQRATRQQASEWIINFWLMALYLNLMIEREVSHSIRWTI